MIPDAEMVAVTLLRERLGVPVYITPPRDIPSTYVRITRLGGVRRNEVTDAALIGVNCYSKSRCTAAKLANEARAVLDGSAGEKVHDAGIRFWREVAGPVNYPQPDVDRVRYQFTGELRLATNNITHS